MQQNENQTKTLPEDQDIMFDMHETSTTSGEITHDDTISTLDKEEEISRNELRPLTEQEKKPKLQDAERIKEMSRRTDIDD